MKLAIILVIIAEFWLTMGQVCFKKGADNLTAGGPDGKPWLLRLALSVTRDPVLWLGGASMVVGMLFWFAALESGELSYVYPLGSIQYIFILFAAHFFLQEKINATKLIGTLLIMAGLILTAAS